MPSPDAQQNRGNTVQRLPIQLMHLKYMQGTQNAGCAGVSKLQYCMLWQHNDALDIEQV